MLSLLFCSNNEHLQSLQSLPWWDLSYHFSRISIRAPDCTNLTGWSIYYDATFTNLVHIAIRSICAGSCMYVCFIFHRSMTTQFSSYLAPLDVRVQRDCANIPLRQPPRCAFGQYAIQSVVVSRASRLSSPPPRRLRILCRQERDHGDSLRQGCYDFLSQFPRWKRTRWQ